MKLDESLYFMMNWNQQPDPNNNGLHHFVNNSSWWMENQQLPQESQIPPVTPSYTYGKSFFIFFFCFYDK